MLDAESPAQFLGRRIQRPSRANHAAKPPANVGEGQGRRDRWEPAQPHGRFFTIEGPISLVMLTGRCRQALIASCIFGFRGVRSGRAPPFRTQ